MSLRVAVFGLVVLVVSCVYDIEQFGAVAHSDTVSDQFRNSKAILAAVQAANSSEGERIVRIPNSKFYSMPIRIEDVHNISIEIAGKLIASKNVKYWPRKQG